MVEPYKAPSLRNYSNQDSQKTTLLYSWTLWYHSPESNDWSEDSYQKIYTFSTIEEFWSC